jgi:hypothetical protein
MKNFVQLPQIETTITEHLLHTQAKIIKAFTKKKTSRKPLEYLLPVTYIAPMTGITRIVEAYYLNLKIYILKELAMTKIRSGKTKKESDDEDFLDDTEVQPSPQKPTGKTGSLKDHLQSTKSLVMDENALIKKVAKLMKLLGMKKPIEKYTILQRANLEIHASMEYYAETVNEYYPDNEEMTEAV